MKPKIIHQEAMDFSFKAKQALDQGNYSIAFDLYIKAAKLESQVAEFYFDKPEFEPTRSFIIRSAAFLNMKAGLIDEAKKYIFFGLLNIKDEFIVNQLNNALELAVSLANMPSNEASREYNYINLLRQSSIFYVLEPANRVFEHSVSLEAIKNFSEDYLKSLKAYACSKLKKVLSLTDELELTCAKQIDKFINPLVTNSSYGSFKFAIANDFIAREGELKEVLDLKVNVITNYHHEIFVNPLSDSDIDVIKNEYTEEEVNNIFRPLTKIKANNTPYKVGYYDNDFNKKYVNKILNRQRKRLLTIKSISQEDIGELESSIIHKRSMANGKIHQTTILKEQMKKFEFDYQTNQIEPSDVAPIILSENVILNVLFNSEIGFTISFEDLKIECTGIEYNKTLTALYNTFYRKAKELAKTSEKSDDELKDWEIVKKLIGNPNEL